MKKIYVIVVLLVLIFSFSACTKKEKIATKEQIAEFIDIYNSAIDGESFSYKFEYKFNEKWVTKNRKYVSNLKMNGIVTYNDEELWPNISYKYDGVYNKKTITPTSIGKNVKKEKIKESVVRIDTGNAADVEFYINSIVKIKDENGKSLNKIKTSNSDYMELSVVTLDSITYDITNLDNYFFVDGNKYKIVINESYFIKEYMVVLDGDKIKSIEYTMEERYYTKHLKIKFIDYQEIERPKNASDYENE